MSTKCTVLSGNAYHFFYNQVSKKYEIKVEDEEAMSEFLQRAGELLEGCPFSDAGLYFIDLKKGTTERKYHKFECKRLNAKNQEIDNGV